MTITNLSWVEFFSKLISVRSQPSLFQNNTIISLSLLQQVCLMRLYFERYFSHDFGGIISPILASLNTLAHDVINVLYYEHWTDEQKYFYVYSEIVNSTCT